MDQSNASMKLDDSQTGMIMDPYESQRTMKIAPTERQLIQSETKELYELPVVESEPAEEDNELVLDANQDKILQHIEKTRKDELDKEDKTVKGRYIIDSR